MQDDKESAWKRECGKLADQKSQLHDIDDKIRTLPDQEMQARLQLNDRD